MDWRKCKGLNDFSLAFGQAETQILQHRSRAIRRGEKRIVGDDYGQSLASVMAQSNLRIIEPPPASIMSRSARLEDNSGGFSEGNCNDFHKTRHRSAPHH
jgi:hypothetical protein